MKSFNSWKNDISNLTPVDISQEDFLKICMEYFNVVLCGSMKTYLEYKQENIVESSETSRYAIEVNYRTTPKEALEGFAKICLGYVSAALKNHGYHTKHVFTEKPLRLLVSSRNWDSGEWAGAITWNHEHSCFVLSKGFYNKDRKTISIQSSKKCSGDSAAEIAKELHNTMHYLKGQPDRHLDKLKPTALKRGPKG